MGKTRNTGYLPNIVQYDENNNVILPSLTGSGNRMVISSSTGVLSAQDIPTLSALGGVPTSRTLTINGVSYDLSANRSWSALPIGGTTGQILTKNSGTDYDAAWMENYADWTAVLKHRVKASEAITKGQAVYVSSADGTNMIVSKASNTTEATSSKTMGLLESTVSTNGIANVITEGLLAGLNTATANAGDPVWLGTGGNLIYGLLNKPVAPAHLVFIGVVTRSNANNGEIFVKVQNGFELDELHDLSVKNASDGDMIKYVASTGLWTKIAATTTNITEGTNLYYTDTRVGSYLTANSYATQSYVGTAIANLVASAPATLDTLNELATALGNDAAFSTTISTALGNRLRVDINTQGLSATLQGYGRTNLGLGTAATSNTGDFAAASHIHSIANVTGLQTALDGKQASLGFTPYNSTNPAGYITGVTNITGNSGTSNYGVNNSITSTDLNNLYRAGFYSGSSITNGIGGGGDQGIIVVPTWQGTDASNRYTLQIGSVIGGSLNYRSTNISGVGTWKTVLDSSNYTSYALATSGGTMTGQLQINTPSNGVGSGFQLYSTTSQQYLSIYSNGALEAMVNYRNNAAQWYVGVRTSVQLVGDTGFHFYNTNSAQTVGGFTIGGAFYALGDITGGRLRNNNSLSLASYQTVNPSSNVYLYSSPNDRDMWIMLDSADTGSNWGMYYRQIDSTLAIGGQATLPANSVAWVGGGNSGLRAYICLSDGTAYVSSTFTAGGDITAFSDARLKDNIEIIPNAISKIKSIRGVTYTRTDAEDSFKNIRHTGVLAQEVLEVLPEVVHQDSNTGTYSVAYGNMVGLLIEAVKEQQTHIESQKSEIEELKDLVKQLINK